MANPNIPVPSGLQEMLQNFVVAVLREQPADIVDFASQYFTSLLHHRDANEMPRVEQTDEVRMSDEDDNIDEEFAMMARQANYARRKSISAERYDPDADDADDDERIVHPKTDAQRQSLSNAISKILIFANLDQDQMNQVLDAMFESKVTAGTHVIDEGDDGDNFYVIESGDFDIFIKDRVTGSQNNVGCYKGSGAFGELALMYNCPRAATIIATTDGSLWAMDRVTFRRIIVKNAAKKRKAYEDFLETVPCLSTLTIEERMKVADAMVTKTYKNGEFILRQGDPADYFYMVAEGHVVIKRRGDNPNNPEEEVQLQRYSKGAYFGELALLQNQPRAASAIADGDCKCAVLDVKAFERLLGPCKELLMRNIPLYEQQLSQICRDMCVQ